MSERMRLLNKIQQFQFMMVEADLFLDAHCGSAEAGESFAAYQELYENAKSEYENCYGPLTYNGVDFNRDGWSWVNTPWPWEVEGC